MRSSPISLPRSGPVPAGVTAASRSWTRSETSTISVILCLLRKVQNHLQLVCIQKLPAAPREELGGEPFGNDLRDGPGFVWVSGREGLHEAGAPTVAPGGAGGDERGHGDNVCVGVPDQGVSAMVEVEGPRRRDRPRERLRDQHPRQARVA